MLEIEATYVEEVHCVALHPSGTLLVAGFQDKLRLMTVLVDELKCVGKETCMAFQKGFSEFVAEIVSAT